MRLATETRVQVYRYTSADLPRMGRCEWLPTHGDLCVRIGQSGDCFHDYIACREQPDGTFKQVGEFSAYAFGALEVNFTTHITLKRVNIIYPDVRARFEVLTPDQQEKVWQILEVGGPDFA